MSIQKIKPFKSRYGIFLRGISLSLIATFSFHEFVFAAGSELGGAAQKTPITISQDRGWIRKSFYKGTASTIVEIEDAHQSLGAQESISRILDDLVTQYDLRVVGLEGSSVPVDTTLVSSFPAEEARKKISEYFLKEGRISAGEFYSMVSEKPVRLYGVEEEALYEQNVVVFKQIIEDKLAVRGDLEDLQAVLRRLEEKVYSPKLKEIVSKKLLRRSGEIKFTEYWDQFSRLAGEYQISYESYPSLKALVQAVALEKQIDFEKAQSEREALILFLGRSLPKTQVEKLVRNALEYKQGKIAASSFHQGLLEMARGLASESEYLNVRRYSEYLSRYDRIDLVQIFEEMEGFENAAKKKIFVHRNEKRLSKLTRDAEIFSRLLDTSLSGKDYEKIKDHPYLRKLEILKKSLESLGKEYGVPTANVDFGLLEKNLPNALKFYELASQRNHAILQNTLDRMKKEKVRIAAVVTGGFHTEGLSKLLQSEELSYLVVMPKFDEKSPKRPYITLLTKKPKEYEKLFKESDLYLSPSALFTAKGLGEEGARNVVLLMTAAARLASPQFFDGSKLSPSFITLYVARYREGLKKRGVQGFMSPEKLEQLLTSVKNIRRSGEGYRIETDFGTYKIAVDADGKNISSEPARIAEKTASGPETVYESALPSKTATADHEANFVNQFRVRQSFFAGKNTDPLAELEDNLSAFERIKGISFSETQKSGIYAKLRATAEKPGQAQELPAALAAARLAGKEKPAPVKQEAPKTPSAVSKTAAPVAQKLLKAESLRAKTYRVLDIAVLSISIGLLGLSFHALFTGIVIVLLFRVGLSAAKLIGNEWAHLAAGLFSLPAKKVLNLSNVLGNVPARQWASSLIPFLRPVGLSKVTLADLDASDEKTVRLAGFFGSTFFFLTVAVIGLSFLNPLFSIPLIAGAGLVWVDSAVSDLLPSILPESAQQKYFSWMEDGSYYCGVLFYTGYLAFNDVVDFFEEAGFVLRSRGEQAAGLARIFRNRKGVLTSALIRMTNPKREDLPKLLTRGLKRNVSSEERKSIATSLARILGHYRFGTSSAPSVAETHPHTWLGLRDALRWTFKKGAGLVSLPILVGIYIAHNGDFDYWKFWPKQKKLDNDEVRELLDTVLYTNDYRKGDSPKIAGMMELLNTQGLWDASIRLSFIQKLCESLEDIKKKKLSQKELSELTKIFEKVFQEYAASDLKDIGAFSEITPAQKNALKAKLIEKLRDNPILKNRSEANIGSFIQGAIDAFIENDSYTAVRLFMAGAEGTFGLGVITTLNEKTYGASRGQPFSFGFTEDGRGVAGLSDPTALKVTLPDAEKNLFRYRLDLEPGEVVEVGVEREEDPASPGNFLYSDVVKIYSETHGRFLTAEELQENRFIDMENNPLISPLGPRVPDPIGQDVRDTEEVMKKLLGDGDQPGKDWEDGSFNRQTQKDLFTFLLEKDIAVKIRSSIFNGLSKIILLDPAKDEEIRLRARQLAALMVGSPSSPSIGEKALKALIEVEATKIRAWALDELEKRQKNFGDDTVSETRQKARELSDALSSGTATDADITRIAQDLLETSRTTPMDPATARSTPSPGITPVDILMFGKENSLWGGAEEEKARLGIYFPELTVESTSSNKLIDSLEAALESLKARIAENPDATEEEKKRLTVTIDDNGRIFVINKDTIFLGISQSGETAPTFAASDALQAIFGNRVFALTGEMDSQMGKAVGQEYYKGAPFSRRILTNGSGRRLAEANVLTDIATRVTLRELTWHLAADFAELLPTAEPFGMTLNANDLKELRRTSKSTVQDAQNITGWKDGKKKTTPVNRSVLKVAKRWSLNILEDYYALIGTMLIFFIAHAVFGLPFLFTGIFQMVAGWAGIDAGYSAQLIAGLLNTLFYFMIYKWVFVLGMRGIRIATGTLPFTQWFARMGKRSLAIGGKPSVHQSLKMYFSKIFSAQAYGIASLEVQSGNVKDHFLDRLSHLIARGSQLLLFQEDKRLKTQRKLSGNADMTGTQAGGIQEDLGIGSAGRVGADIVMVTPSKASVKKSAAGMHIDTDASTMPVPEIMLQFRNEFDRRKKPESPSLSDEQLLKFTELLWDTASFPSDPADLFRFVEQWTEEKKLNIPSAEVPLFVNLVLSKNTAGETVLSILKKNLSRDHAYAVQRIYSLDVVTVRQLMVGMVLGWAMGRDVSTIRNPLFKLFYRVASWFMPRNIVRLIFLAYDTFRTKSGTKTHTTASPSSLGNLIDMVGEIYKKPAAQAAAKNPPKRSESPATPLPPRVRVAESADKKPAAARKNPLQISIVGSEVVLDVQTASGEKTYSLALKKEGKKVFFSNESGSLRADLIRKDGGQVFLAISAASATAPTLIALNEPQLRALIGLIRGGAGARLAGKAAELDPRLYNILTNDDVEELAAVMTPTPVVAETVKPGETIEVLDEDDILAILPEKNKAKDVPGILGETKENYRWDNMVSNHDFSFTDASEESFVMRFPRTRLANTLYIGIQNTKTGDLFYGVKFDFDPETQTFVSEDGFITAEFQKRLPIRSEGKTVRVEKNVALIKIAPGSPYRFVELADVQNKDGEWSASLSKGSVDSRGIWIRVNNPENPGFYDKAETKTLQGKLEAPDASTPYSGLIPTPKKAAALKTPAPATPVPTTTVAAEEEPIVLKKAPDAATEEEVAAPVVRTPGTAETLEAPGSPEEEVRTPREIPPPAKVTAPHRWLQRWSLAGYYLFIGIWIGRMPFSWTEILQNPEELVRYTNPLILVITPLMLLGILGSAKIASRFRKFVYTAVLVGVGSLSGLLATGMVQESALLDSVNQLNLPSLPGMGNAGKKAEEALKLASDIEQQKRTVADVETSLSALEKEKTGFEADRKKLLAQKEELRQKSASNLTALKKAEASEKSALQDLESALKTIQSQTQNLSKARAEIASLTQKISEKKVALEAIKLAQARLEASDLAAKQKKTDLLRQAQADTLNMIRYLKDRKPLESAEYVRALESFGTAHVVTTRYYLSERYLAPHKHSHYSIQEKDVPNIVAVGDLSDDELASYNVKKDSRGYWLPLWDDSPNSVLVTKDKLVLRGSIGKTPALLVVQPGNRLEQPASSNAPLRQKKAEAVQVAGEIKGFEGSLATLRSNADQADKALKAAETLRTASEKNRDQARETLAALRAETASLSTENLDKELTTLEAKVREAEEQIQILKERKIEEDRKLQELLDTQNKDNAAVAPAREETKVASLDASKNKPEAVQKTDLEIKQEKREILLQKVASVGSALRSPALTVGEFHGEIQKIRGILSEAREAGIRVNGVREAEQRLRTLYASLKKSPAPSSAAAVGARLAVSKEELVIQTPENTSVRSFKEKWDSVLRDQLGPAASTRFKLHYVPENASGFTRILERGQVAGIVDETSLEHPQTISILFDRLSKQDRETFAVAYPFIGKLLDPDKLRRLSRQEETFLLYLISQNLPKPSPRRVVYLSGRAVVAPEILSADLSSPAKLARQIDQATADLLLAKLPAEKEKAISELTDASSDILSYLKPAAGLSAKASQLSIQLAKQSKARYALYDPTYQDLSSIAIPAGSTPKSIITELSVFLKDGSGAAWNHEIEYLEKRSPGIFEHVLWVKDPSIQTKEELFQLYPETARFGNNILFAPDAKNLKELYQARQNVPIASQFIVLTDKPGVIGSEKPLEDASVKEAFVLSLAPKAQSTIRLMSAAVRLLLNPDQKPAFVFRLADGSFEFRLPNAVPLGYLLENARNANKYLTASA